MIKKIKVLCAMSGGVDSSVAAVLLKKEGYNVIGIFMKLWRESHCLADFDKAFFDAKKVADILEIPFYATDFNKEFKKKVVDNFLKEYATGQTPNPCVRCNKFIKFGLLFDEMKRYGAQYVATGHYARINPITPQPPLSGGNPRSPSDKGGWGGSYENSPLIRGARGVKEIPTPKFLVRFKLLKAKDKCKDQSYFLYNLTQEKSKRLLFPIGNYTKQEVRELAEKFKLPVLNKKESQEVCFEKEIGHSVFLKRHLKAEKGDIITVDGQKIGEHKGLPFYTIGQRKGIEIGGTGPYYVVELDFKNNRLIVTGDAKHPALSRDFLICKDVNWVSGQIPKLPLKCKTRSRYGQKEVGAEVVFAPRSFGWQSNNYLVKFETAQFAITAGQSVVFYRGDEVLGGGIIENFQFSIFNF